MITSIDMQDPQLFMNHPLIDEQHRALISMITELDERMSHEFNQGLLDALQGMMAYAVTHFEDEEKLMLDTGWDSAAAHRKLHEVFMEKTQLFNQQAGADYQWTALDVLRFLLHWLINHIKVEDRLFFTWLEQQNAAKG